MDFLYTEKGELKNGSGAVLLRGVGLGGWLLPEGYMWKLYTKCDRPRRIEALVEKLCGPEYAEGFWQRYYASYYTEKDIEWLAAQGMNSIRLPLNSRHLFTLSECGELRFNERVLRHVDNCLSWCEKRGMYLFLDMHAAPGGQTGQNIDDSAADLPELFMEEKNRQQLVEMWQMLARRYKDNAAIGGYDLLNEPLPEWNRQYNHMLLPLYRSIIEAIRRIDTKHVISLEGAHWATDISIFDDFSPEEAADNILLQFHKYWSDPDEESIARFISLSRRLNAPLWMGEGGENNLQWYTYAFSMYERNNIGWNFWTCKKMDTPNSPITFEIPEGWDEITDYLDGGAVPGQARARRIFDNFLDAVAKSSYHESVINALCRRRAIEIPAAAYDCEAIVSPRVEGAVFRTESRASLIFADGHKGKADWNRYGGEAQPESEKILLCLRSGDKVSYRYNFEGNNSVTLTPVFSGCGRLTVQGQPVENGLMQSVPFSADGLIHFCCTEGEVQLEKLLILEA